MQPSLGSSCLYMHQPVCCYNGKTYEPGATIMTITTTLECTGDGINSVTMQRPGTYCDYSAQQQYSPIRDGSSGQKITETESGNIRCSSC